MRMSLTQVFAIGKVPAMRQTALADTIGAAEAAALLHIDRSVLTRWVQAGRLTPVFKLPGKTGAYLFHRADVEALAATK